MVPQRLHDAGEVQLNTERAATSGRALAGRLALVAKLGITALALWFFIRAVTTVDWHLVWNSVEGLVAWQWTLLLAVVVVRQVVNAAPLALFVPGLGIARALSNDLSASLVSSVAPPPSDVVLRLGMFRSWGVGATEGLTGVMLNTFTYYVARFGAPVVGLVLALATDQVEDGFVAVALAGALVVGVIVVGLVLAARDGPAAARLGERAGHLVRRVVRGVDPTSWAARIAQFQHQVSGRLRASGRPALGCQVLLVLTEALLLVMSFRFAGVSPSVASGSAIVVALLVSYPLTALPFSGVGVLDAAVLGILGLEPGLEGAEEVAAMVIWRACLMLVPLLLGAACLLVWRHRRPAGPAA